MGSLQLHNPDIDAVSNQDQKANFQGRLFIGCCHSFAGLGLAVANRATAQIG
jgi:hypothetical protein